MANDEGVLSRCIMLFRSFLGGESVGSVANGLYSSVIHRSANGMTISLSTEALVRVVEMEGWFVSASMKASTGDKFSASLGSSFLSHSTHPTRPPPPPVITVVGTSFSLAECVRIVELHRQEEDGCCRSRRRQRRRTRRGAIFPSYM